MNGAVILLAGTLLTVVGSVVGIVLTRKPNATESQVANDGSWEKLNQGWVVRVQYLDGVVKAMQTDMAGLKASQDRSEQTLAMCFEYIRNILSWGHGAGAVNPPDPPVGLVIPDE